MLAVNYASSASFLMSHVVEHPPPGFGAWAPGSGVFVGKPRSVVSKTLARFHVATLGLERLGAFCMKTLWPDLYVGKFSRVITQKTHCRMGDPKRKTKCDCICDADGNIKGLVLLSKFQNFGGTTCFGS